MERSYPVVDDESVSLLHSPRQGPKSHVFPGEAQVNAMTSIGAATTKAPYLADGRLRVTDIDNMEICLLETSNAFMKADKAKVSFDHHEAMFALLAMVKKTAQKYPFATYDELSKMKLCLFMLTVHAIRIWSMRSPEKTLF
ncbi:hypothetical protein BJV82DRAFT_678530 [Fennellomyces sp. T-0311]|nr:hypothetical protein BJV82DRAFT_678530 [Fennellomyces sp. T-0311]